MGRLIEWNDRDKFRKRVADVLNISEVVEFTSVEEPETLWERIGTGFMESLENLGNFFVELFVLLIVASPYLIPLALVTALVIYLIRRNTKKNTRPIDTELTKDDSTGTPR